MPNRRIPPKPPGPPAPARPRAGRRKRADSGDPLPDYRPDYISLLAHQLLTPLTTILSSADGLIRRASQMTDSDVRNRAGKIRRAGLRLTEMIQAILSHTRATAGAMNPDVDDFDLSVMIRRVCGHQQEDHPTHPIDIDVGDRPFRFHGDPLLLEQAVTIVIANAVKYSPADSLIRVVGKPDDGTVSISIRDQGIGVLSDDLPHLTEPFYRGHNARHMPGTGLGLSLARHIVDLHGGALKVESREGRGTTVTITLPLVQSFSEGSGI
ncbi:MAG: HAMP domain-containing sensor histidine kinase [Microvirga sp.]